LRVRDLSILLAFSIIARIAGVFKSYTKLFANCTAEIGMQTICSLRNSVLRCRNEIHMPFEKGHPKYGGRIKGKLSHAKMQVEDVKQTFLRMGVNPIERLCRVAKSKKPVPDHVIKALTELCRYYAPRLSTQNINGRIDGELQVATIREILLTADDETQQVLEALSLKLSAADLERRRPDIIDIVALPPASDDAGDGSL
jgi:hypothetical protein